MQIKKVTASDAQEPAMTLSDPDIPRTNLEKKTALKKPAWIFCLSVKSNLILFKHLKHLQNTLPLYIIFFSFYNLSRSFCFRTI